LPIACGIVNLKSSKINVSAPIEVDKKVLGITEFRELFE